MEGPLAQLAEQGTLNAKVGGSIPSRPTQELGSNKMGTLSLLAEVPTFRGKKSPNSLHYYILKDFVWIY